MDAGNPKKGFPWDVWYHVENGVHGSYLNYYTFLAALRGFDQKLTKILLEKSSKKCNNIQILNDN